MEQLFERIDPRSMRSMLLWGTSNVRRILIALVLLAVKACKDHADTARTNAQSCERVYEVCPNEAPASEDDARICADEFRGRCGAELRQYVQCASGKCDDAGAIDRVRLEQACFASIEAYRTCEESDGGVEARRDEGQLPPFATDASAARD